MLDFPYSRRKKMLAFAPAPTRGLSPVLSSDLGIAIERLSPAAQRICKCLAEGQTINEIANAMQVSWHTVHSHVAKIRECFVDLGLDELVLEA
jgi:DNA-binding NarL/FixJ family response regulator